MTVRMHYMRMSIMSGYNMVNWSVSKKGTIYWQILGKGYVRIPEYLGALIVFRLLFGSQGRLLKTWHP